MSSVVVLEVFDPMLCSTKLRSESGLPTQFKMVSQKKNMIRPRRRIWSDSCVSEVTDKRTWSENADWFR
jgi:hypothetical protein